LKTKTLSKIFLLFLAFQAPFFTGCKKNPSKIAVSSSAEPQAIPQAEASGQKDTQNNDNNQTQEVKNPAEPQTGKQNVQDNKKNSQVQNIKNKLEQSKLDADSPTIATSQRIITKEITGDSVSWLEIATIGNYSLIIRAYPCVQNFSYVPTSKAEIPAHDKTKNHIRYTDTEAEKEIIKWYQTIPNDSNLKARATGHTARYQMGCCFYNSTNESSLTDNLPNSKEYKDAVGTGISIPFISEDSEKYPFLLSYQEAVNYLSNTYIKYNDTNGEAEVVASSEEAKANFQKLIELMTVTYNSDFTQRNKAKSQDLSIRFWLRSPANQHKHISKYLISFIGNDLVYKPDMQKDTSTITPQQGFGAIGLADADTKYDLVPCLWVDSQIFNTQDSDPPKR